MTMMARLARFLKPNRAQLRSDDSPLADILPAKSQPEPAQSAVLFLKMKSGARAKPVPSPPQRQVTDAFVRFRRLENTFVMYIE